MDETINRDCLWPGIAFKLLWTSRSSRAEASSSENCTPLIIPIILISWSSLIMTVLAITTLLTLYFTSHEQSLVNITRVQFARISLSSITTSTINNNSLLCGKRKQWDLLLCRYIYADSYIIWSCTNYLIRTRLSMQSLVFLTYFKKWGGFLVVWMIFI